MQFKGINLEPVTSKFVLPPSKILITGGLGFIFSHVAEWFAMRGHEVHVLDNHSDGSHPRLVGPFLNQGIVHHKCDVNDVIEYMEVALSEAWSETDSKFDYIIHAAAESNVDKSILDSAPFYHANIRGTIEMLQWWLQSEQENLKQFLFVNTDEVYGSVEFCVDNKAPQFPSSPYAASKAAAGNICHSYRVTYDMPIKEFRICNVLGKRQANTKLVPKAIEFIKREEEFPVYGNGAAMREYIDVRLIGLIIEHFWMMCYNDTDKYANDYCHNITFRNARSINSMLAMLGTKLGKKIKIGQGERPGHDLNYAMIPAKWLDILPKISLSDTLDWILTEEED